QPTPQRPAPPQRSAGTGERNRRSRIGPDLLKGLGPDPSPSRTSRPSATVSGEARASINAAIRRALIPCERQPLPSPEAAAIKVDVRVSLNPNGSLASAQVVHVRNDNPALRIYEQRMRDLALAIVRACTPIRGLPAEYYDVPRGWRQFTYQFDPRQS
ncbi:MAG TPA: cell envelope biogenesis protein TolA, partial [Allosphingosinicella sp.]|nr:cell envelope biogenesis protein TolA [Allosphingosinicella sp.]